MIGHDTDKINIASQTSMVDASAAKNIAPTVGADVTITGLTQDAPDITALAFIPDSGTLKIGDTAVLRITADAIGYNEGATLITVNGQTVTGFTDNGNNTYDVTYTVSEFDTDRAIDTLPASATLYNGPVIGNTYTTITSGNTPAVDANRPNVPSAATIAAGAGWTVDYISDTNKAAVKLSGSKSTDTTSITIDIDDEDTFDTPKTIALNGLGTETTYADTVGIDVTTATALADGNIAVRITASDAAGNTSAQTILVGTATFKKDIVLPTISSVVIDQNTTNRKIGDTVLITTTAGGSEDGLTASNATFNAQSVTLSGAGSGTYTGTYTVIAAHNDITNPEATAITLTDDAGNVSSTGASSGSAFTIDANRPTITSIETVDLNADGDLDALHITFTENV